MICSGTEMQATVNVLKICEGSNHFFLVPIYGMLGIYGLKFQILK